MARSLHVALDARIGRGWRLGLDGMRSILFRMTPITFPVILVAGTNGKGSVCAALHNYLWKSGLKTGLTTSPHLVDVRERIVVDGEMISEDAFESVYRRIESLDDQNATYFETLALMAIEHFIRERVGVAVVEIGMGGRLDAFNALDPIVSVVTSIGMEHTKWLGDSLEKIAIEKAQVARKGRPCVLGDALPALRAEVERIGARPVMSLSGSDDFTERNISIAVEAARVFLNETGRTFDSVECERLCREARWPGRFEIIRATPTIILDAAHNPHAARALAAKLVQEFPERKFVFLASFLDDKDVRGFFAELDRIAARWIITQVSDTRAMNASDVPSPAGSIIEPDLIRAIAAARSAAGADGIVIVCGSIYLLGDFIRSIARFRTLP